MFRRRRRNGKIIVGCFVLLLSGFLYGFFTNEGQEQNDLNPNNEAKSPDIAIEERTDDTGSQNPSGDAHGQTEELDREINNTLPVVESDIVTNNTKLIFKTYYERTRDTIKQEKNVPTVMVGLSLDELEGYLKNNYHGWTVRELNKDYVELYQVSSQISPNHYVIKNYNGYISVFQVNEDGNLKLLNQTEIPVSALSHVDQQKMQEGIVVKGKEGINQILEDYSS